MNLPKVSIKNSANSSVTFIKFTDFFEKVIPC